MSEVYYGRYKILGEIGEGGMAKVYVAQDTQMERLVALKLMGTGQLASVEERQRFLRETKLAGRLKHPNIVPVHDMGEKEGKYFFVMDFVEGKDFLDYITKNKPSREEVLKIILKVCDAMQYAHMRGVIHRDLKPENIIIDKQGEPKVVDFGLAKEIGEAKGAAFVTKTNIVMGTASYMSPEQACGDIDEIDIRSDIYSIGATMYRLLCRKVPFEGKTIIDTLRKTIEEDPRPPSFYNKAIDWELDAIIMKALEKDKDKRYHTAETLAQDIRNYLEGKPITAAKITILYKLRKKIVKNKAFFGTILAAIILILVLTVYFLYAGYIERLKRYESKTNEILENVRKMSLVDFTEPVKDNLTHELSTLKDKQTIRMLIKTLKDKDWKVREISARVLGWFKDKEAIKPLRDVSIDKDERFEVKLQAVNALSWIGKDEFSKEVFDAVIKAYEVNDDYFQISTRDALARIKIPSSQPNTAEGYRKIGVVFWIKKEYNKAIEAYSKAIGLNPAYAQAYNNRGIAYKSKGDYDSAIYDYSRAIELDMKNARAYNNRGLVYIEKKNYDKAIKDFSKAIEINPRFAIAYNNRGFAYNKMEDYKKAIADFSKTIEIKPDFQAPYYNRGLAYYKKEDYAEAIRDYSRAIELNPKDFEVWFNLAGIYALSGDKEGMLRHLRKAIELKPSICKEHAKKDTDFKKYWDDPDFRKLIQ